MSSNARPTPTVEELSRRIEEQQQQIAALTAALAARPRFLWLRFTRSRLVLLALIFPLLIISGIALAAIPDAGGVITGCYHNAKGSLRVIDVEAGGQCNNQETPLAWNQAGPQGPQGPKGDPGPQGEPGLSGYTFVMNQTSFDSSIRKGVAATCPTGQVLTGGGASIFPGIEFGGGVRFSPVAITNSFPLGATQWYAEAIEIVPDSENWQLTAYAICVDFTE